MILPQQTASEFVSKQEMRYNDSNLMEGAFCLKYSRIKIILSVGIAVLASVIIIGRNSRNSSKTSTNGNEYYYSANVYSLPDELGNLQHLKYYNGLIYAVANFMEEDSLISRIIAIKPDGSEYDFLNFMTVSTQSTIVQMDVTITGSIWIIEASTDTNNQQTNHERHSRYSIKRLDNKGNLEIDESLFLTDAPIMSIDYFCVTPDDTLIIAERGILYIMDKELNTFQTLPVGNLSALSVSRDGAAYALIDSVDGLAVKIVDVKNGELGKSVATLSHLGDNLLPGESLGFGFLSYDAVSLFAYDIESGLETIILNWRDFDFNGFKLSIHPLDDGSILCLVVKPGEGDAVVLEFIVLVRSEYATEAKTVLTLATLSLSSELSAQINMFNQMSDEYRISVVDYSNSTMSGLNKLAVELITGNGPDIIDLTSFPGNNYAANGFLEDLNSYFEADALVSRNDYLEILLSNIEKEGGIYEAVSSFGIVTIVGSTSVVGEQAGWTLDDLLALHEQKAMQSAIAGVTQDLFLQLICNFASDEFICWSTGEVSFGTEEFISLLEYSYSLPASINLDDYTDEYECIATGQSFLSFTSVRDFFEIQFLELVFNDEITYIGIPIGEGSGSYIVLNTALGISVYSQNKVAAWDFFRFVLSEEYQKDNSYKYGFPTNKAAFELMITEAQIINNEKSPNAIGYSWNDTHLAYKAASQSQIDKIVNLINNAEGVTRYDENVTQIISEAVGPFFSSEHSAEETAEIIQSRVEVYVSEQRQ